MLVSTTKMFLWIVFPLSQQALKDTVQTPSLRAAASSKAESKDPSLDLGLMGAENGVCDGILEGPVDMRK